MRLVSIDPGLRVLGVAVFDDGSLTEVKLVRGAKSGRGPEAWRALVSALQPTLERADLLVMERPQIYPGRRAVGDPDDLMELMGVLGAVVGSSSITDVVTYRPKDWKGSVPKPAHQARLYSSLTPTERLLVDAVKPASLKHNALDAVGIGYYYLRSKKEKCNPSSATTATAPSDS